MNQDTIKVKIGLIIKHIFDILLSASVLICLSPVIAVIAIAVRLDSHGPIIYRHRRIGKDGKPFDVYKFRSMQSNSDDTNYKQYLKDLIESSKNGKGKPYRKMEGDPRVTRVGNFIRQYYLDELPQFWNVLKGDMSVVGPRPHVQLEVDYYTPEQRRRLTVKPGLTGLWQVESKSGCTFLELIDLDLKYIDHWSLGLDFKIILRTVIVMLRGGEGFWARMAKTIPLISKTGTRSEKPLHAVERPLQVVDANKALVQSDEEE